MSRDLTPQEIPFPISAVIGLSFVNRSDALAKVLNVGSKSSEVACWFEHLLGASNQQD